MRKLRCVIVDDEPIARRGMRRLVDLREELEPIGSASNVAEAEKLIENSEEGVDLLFLDIDMDGESGMDFARRLEQRPMIVFTTAFSNYALESYEVAAEDYLLKPVRRERFNMTVDRILERMERENTEGAPVSQDSQGGYITLKADRKFIRVGVREIIYVEGLGDYLVIHLEDKRITTRMTFKSLEGILDGKDFLRVNKSYMVNCVKIESYNSNEVWIGETMIPVGATYRDNMMERLQGLSHKL